MDYDVLHSDILYVSYLPYNCGILHPYNGGTQVWTYITHRGICSHQYHEYWLMAEFLLYTAVGFYNIRRVLWFILYTAKYRYMYNVPVYACTSIL